MLRVTIEQWRMFHAVVKYGGFAQAAKEIYKSASSVHYAVSKIEDILNITLLKVEGRNIIPTEKGEKIYALAEKLLSDAMSLEEYILNINNKKSHAIKIAIDELFSINFIRNVLQMSCQDFPIKDIVIYQVSSQHFKRAQREDCSLSILSIPIPGFYLGGSFNVNYIAVTGYANRALTNTPIQFETLSALTEVCVLKDISDQNRIFGKDKCWIVDKLSTALDLVCEGVGFAWLPEVDVKYLLKEGRLFPLRFYDRPNTQTREFFLNIDPLANSDPNIIQVVRRFNKASSPMLLKIG